MKITGPGKIKAPAVKKAHKSGSAADFQAKLETDEIDAIRAPTPAAPLAAVDSLLQFQEAETAADGRSRGLQHGQDVLRQLEGVHRELLLGTISVQRLRSIDRLLRQKIGGFNDPRLQTLIEEIELRAAVELAKLGLESGD